MIEESKHYALAVACGAKRGPKDSDLTFSPASLRDFLKALDQPEQEPVAWLRHDGGHVVLAKNLTAYPEYERRYPIPLYTAPQPDIKVNLEAIPKQISEPVRWLDEQTGEVSRVARVGWTPLYTAPQPRQLQGLTRREFQKAVEGLEDLEDCWVAIQAAILEKNT